jgi:hypothetical protein
MPYSSFVCRKIRRAIVLAVAAVLFLTTSSFSSAQECPCPPGSTASSPPAGQSSLAAAAQDAKAKKAGKAKKVFTDEDMEVRKGPFPKLNLQGVDNGDEILRGMIEYKKKHSAEETETAIHAWYDEHDAILLSAIEESIQLRNLRNANTANGYELCQEGGDYEKCEKRRRSEVRGAWYDQNKISEDGYKMGRIQQAFMRIRNGLGAQGGNYTWFKVRSANGNGSF